MLATVQALQEYTGSSGESVELLYALLAAASARIEMHCRRDWTFDVVPEDLALACVKLAAQMFVVSDLSADVEALVAPYRNLEETT